MAGEVNEEVVNEVPDRRDAIEAAFAAAEEAETVSAPTGDSPPESKTGEDATSRPTVEGTAGAEQVAKPEPAIPATEFAVDKAPQSWRAPQKAKWDKLDPDIRQEVIRRERETTKVLGETAQARQFTQQFVQTIQPFQARLAASGTHPLVAVQELLKSDHILSSAPKIQRAAFMAKLIKDYDIDIAALDDALAGTAAAEDPVESRVQQLLQQQLAPLHQFLSAQKQQEQQREAQESTRIATTIEQMAADPKYPHFEALREDMADLVDIASKRGQYLTLEQAYTRAVGMNPEVSSLVATQRTAAARQTSAQAAHARAQKALAASVSVGGAPNGVPSSIPSGSDRRAVIEAAFEQAAGR
jgi:hypothetical protein